MSAILELLKEEYRMLEEVESLRRIFQPRRMAAPPGYHPFRCVAGSLFALWKQCSFRCRQGTMPNGLEVTGYTILYQIINCGVPVYYVSEELARAVAATEPPSDFTLADLHWPLPGLVLGF